MVKVQFSNQHKFNTFGRIYVCISLREHNIASNLKLKKMTVYF